MPTNANKNEAKQNRETRSTRKAPGTRMGTVQDWRGMNANAGKTSGRHGQAIRDGR